MNGARRGASIRRRATFALAGCAMAALAVLPAPAAPSLVAGPTQVDVKLVIAADVSGSIDNEERTIQRRGTADALSSPDVIRAIQSGRFKRVAIAMIEWSSPDYEKVIAPWTIVSDEASAAELSRKVLAAPKTQGRRTSISTALDVSARLMEESNNDIVAARHVVDISGDGPNNDGGELDQARERTLAKGIAINGLAIMDENANGFYPDLDKYYNGCVIGGPGAFVIVAKRYQDFGLAMQRKLIAEMSPNDRPVNQIPREKPARGCDLFLPQLAPQRVR